MINRANQDWPEELVYDGTIIASLTDLVQDVTERYQPTEVEPEDEYERRTR